RVAPTPLGLAYRVLRALAVDHPGHRPHPRTMVLSMMSIGLTQGLIAPHPSNTVFHNDPPPRERPVIRDVLGRSVFAARFPTQRCTQAFGVQFVNADVGQITNPAHPRWQPLEQLRLLQKRAIGSRPW